MFHWHSFLIARLPHSSTSVPTQETTDAIASNHNSALHCTSQLRSWCRDILTNGPVGGIENPSPRLRREREMFEDLEQTYLNTHYQYTVSITTFMFVLVPNYTIEGHVAGVWHAKKYQAANPSILLHASGSFLCCGIQFLKKAFWGSAFFTNIDLIFESCTEHNLSLYMHLFRKHSKNIGRDQNVLS